MKNKTYTAPEYTFGANQKRTVMANEKGKAFTFPLLTRSPVPGRENTYMGAVIEMEWDHFYLTCISKADSIENLTETDEAFEGKYSRSINFVNLQTDFEGMDFESVQDFADKLSKAINADVGAYLTNSNDEGELGWVHEGHPLVQAIIPAEESIIQYRDYRNVVNSIRRKAWAAGLGELGGDWWERQKDSSDVALTTGRGPLAVAPILSKAPSPVEKYVAGNTIVDRSDGQPMFLSNLKKGDRFECPGCATHPFSVPDSPVLVTLEYQDVGNYYWHCNRCRLLGNGFEGMFTVVPANKKASVSG